MIVLGIAPGSTVTGYGIIKSDQPSMLECLASGSIRLSGIKDFPGRLKKIYQEIASLIEKFDPDSVALEDIFYGRNIKSALMLGQARGAAILAGVNAEKEIAIYAPREVKLAVTGRGSASKEQVQMMVMRILDSSQSFQPLDVSDALAIAICHIHRSWTKNQFSVSP